MENIKQKLNKFLEEFKSNQIQTSNDAMNSFAKLFKNEYIVETINDEHPYYKSYTIRYYIKNGYGIGIEKTWGPGDIAAGGLCSNKGVNVCIFSNLADSNITLFDSSNKNLDLEDVDSLFNFDLSIKNVVNISEDNNFVFKCLPDNIKNKDEIVLERYKNLKIDAEIKHDNDVEDDLISYYGGLDVIICPTEYYLYNSLLENIEDKYFMERAMPLFIKDFPNYINCKIESCEHALYIIKNKEDYYKLIDLNETIYSHTTGIDELEIVIYQTLKEQAELQIKLSDKLTEYTELKNKRHNIIEIVIGKKKKDNIKLEILQRKIDNLKIKLEKISKDLEESNSNNKELHEVVDNAKSEREKLTLKLEKLFEDFTLNPDFEDEIYLDGEYYQKVSLDRLVKQEYKYAKELKELQKMKSYSVIKEEIKKENIMEYSYN